MFHFDPSARWLLMALGSQLVFFCQPTTAQTVVVHDTFDVGDMAFDDDPGDSLDVAWSGGTVVDDTGVPGIGDGNALNAGGDVWAVFDPALLDELGQFIRLSLDFRFDGPVNSGGDASNGNFLFRVGLTDKPNAKTGYIIRIGTGGDGTTAGAPGNGIGLRQNDARAGPYIGGTGVPVQHETFSVNDNERHSASLTVTTITGETTEDGLPTGQLNGVRLDGMVDDVSVSGNFLFGAGGIIDLVELDHIYFDDRGPDFTIDNVKVEFGSESDTLLLGDFNSDGSIDVNDFDIMVANFNTVGISSAEGDINFDRRVDLADFVQFRAIFTAANSNATSVPEPASIQMALLGLSVLVVRRRNEYSTNPPWSQGRPCTASA